MKNELEPDSSALLASLVDRLIFGVEMELHFS